MTSTKYLGQGIDLGGTVITNSGSPSGSTDLTNKGYVDNLVAGLEWKANVRVATTANGTLASAYANSSTVDGVTLATGNRILLKNQTDPKENGLYTVNASGAPTRATDADTTAELNNATVSVTEGTANAGLSYTQTTKNPVIATDNIVFAQFNAGTTYSAGNGLSLSTNTFSLASSAAGAGLTYTTGVLAVVATDTSITVNADDLKVNTAAGGGLTVSSGLKVDGTVSRTFNTGTHASSTSIAVTHSLGVQFLSGVEVYVTSTGERVVPDVVATSTSVMTFSFASAPTTNTLTFALSV